MRYLHVPIERLAPDALVDGVMIPEWSGALAKATAAMLKYERDSTEAYVRVLVKAAAGRGF